MIWRKSKTSDAAGLIGSWKVDPTDQAALNEFGDVTLDFDEKGNLTYTIRSDGKRQVILLSYKVEGNSIVTDQPSRPNEETSAYQISHNVLTIEFAGETARFLRV